MMSHAAARAAFSVEGTRAVVVGAARSGVSAAKLLASRGARVTLTDLRTELDEVAALRELGIALELGAHRLDTLRGADLLVLSPGVSPSHPDIASATAAGVLTIGELELASRWLRGTLVAVTGTKGKSTTTTLVGQMLRDAGRPVSVGGNIGVPLSSQVEASTPDMVHVVEASSFQLETTTSFHPTIAVWLNLTPDHLDRHANESDYVACKARIFANQTEHDWAVVNGDDAVVLEHARRGRGRVVLFGFSREAPLDVTVNDAHVVRRKGDAWRTVLPVSGVRLLGRHSLYDVLAAVAVGSLLGLDEATMRRTVEGFAGLEHALEPAGDVRGVRFINDSKATNIAAALRAIESVGQGATVILGGRFKGGDFGDLGNALVAQRARVVAIGETRPMVQAALGGRVTVAEADTLEEAVRSAFVATAPGSAVLLAPACASFDMFRDYAERGRTFKAEVAKLKAELEAMREQ